MFALLQGIVKGTLFARAPRILHGKFHLVCEIRSRLKPESNAEILGGWSSLQLSCGSTRRAVLAYTLVVSNFILARTVGTNDLKFAIQISA